MRGCAFPTFFRKAANSWVADGKGLPFRKSDHLFSNVISWPDVAEWDPRSKLSHFYISIYGFRRVRWLFADDMQKRKLLLPWCKSSLYTNNLLTTDWKKCIYCLKLLFQEWRWKEYAIRGMISIMLRGWLIFMFSTGCKPKFQTHNTIQRRTGSWLEIMFQGKSSTGENSFER